MPKTIVTVTKYLLGTILVFGANIWVLFMTADGIGYGAGDNTTDWQVWLALGSSLVGLLLIFRPKTRKASLYFLCVPVILAIVVTFL